MAFVSATRKDGRFAPLIRHGLLIAAAFAMLYPLLWMIGSSFKPESEIFSNPSALPTHLSFANFIRGWTALRVDFGVFYKNSFLISGLAVIGNLSACSLTAYAFARLEFRFKWL